MWISYKKQKKQISGIHKGLQHALLVLPATGGRCVRLWTTASVEQTGSESEQGDPILAFVVNGVHVTRQFLFSRKMNSMRNCLEVLSFLFHLFNLKLFYMNLYWNIAIDKWRVFNISTGEGCYLFERKNKRCLKQPCGWVSGWKVHFSSEVLNVLIQTTA